MTKAIVSSQFQNREIRVFVFNIPPTAVETRPQLKVSSDRLVKLGIKRATSGFKGEWFIRYTTAAPYRDVKNMKVTVT